MWKRIIFRLLIGVPEYSNEVIEKNKFDRVHCCLKKNQNVPRPSELLFHKGVSVSRPGTKQCER